MADSIPRCMSAALIHKLHAHAERRCAYFVELHQSGRWTRYYSHDAFVVQMNEAVKTAKQWQDMLNMANRPAPESPPIVAMIPIEKLSSPQEVAVAAAIARWRATVSADISEIVTAA